MSDLEHAVRPTMGCLINDFEMDIDSEQQRCLTLWAVKTAMVIEGVKQAKNGFYTPEERSAFRQNLVPPIQTATWIGRCVQSNNLHGEARKLHVSNPAASNAVEDGCATTFVIGRLVIQVLSVKLRPDTPRLPLQLHMRPGPWDRRLVQIWPIEKRRVHWPPPESFSDLDDGLLNLRRRFAVGTKGVNDVRNLERE
jgi:hypothetical protein